MPHFYAIAIYRLKDFSAAAIPTLPNKKSIQYTKISMLTYIVAFTLVSVLPTFFGYTGFIYLITAACLGGAWFYLGFRGLKATDNNLWARKMFIFSIINITVLCLMMAVK
jgi:protoheme IX farnesyltransferase